MQRINGQLEGIAIEDEGRSVVRAALGDAAGQQL